MLFKSFNISSFFAIRSFISSDKRSWNSYHFHQLLGYRNNFSLIDLSITFFRLRIIFSFVSSLFSKQAKVWLYNLTDQPFNIFVKSLNISNNKLVENSNSVEASQLKERKKPDLAPKPLSYGVELYEWRPGVLSNFNMFTSFIKIQKSFLIRGTQNSYKTRINSKKKGYFKFLKTLKIYQRRKGSSLNKVFFKFKKYGIRRYDFISFIKQFTENKFFKSYKSSILSKLKLNKKNRVSKKTRQRIKRKAYFLKKRLQNQKISLSFAFLKLKSDAKLRKRIKKRYKKWKKNRIKPIEKVIAKTYLYPGNLAFLFKGYFNKLELLIKKKKLEFSLREKTLLTSKYKITMPDYNLLEKHNSGWFRFWSYTRNSKRRLYRIKRKLNFLTFMFNLPKINKSRFNLINDNLVSTEMKYKNYYIYAKKNIKQNLISSLIGFNLTKIKPNRYILTSSVKKYFKLLKFIKQKLNFYKMPIKRLYKISFLSLLSNKRDFIKLNKQVFLKKKLKLYRLLNTRILLWRLKLLRSLNSLDVNSDINLKKLNKTLFYNLNKIKKNYKTIKSFKSKILKSFKFYSKLAKFNSYKNFKGNYFLQPKRKFNEKVFKRYSFLENSYNLYQDNRLLVKASKILSNVNLKKTNLKKIRYNYYSLPMVLTKKRLITSHVKGYNFSRFSKFTKKKYKLIKKLNKLDLILQTRFHTFSSLTRYTKNYVERCIYHIALGDKYADGLGPYIEEKSNYCKSNKISQKEIPYLPSAVFVSRLSRLGLSAITEAKSVNVPLIYLLNASINPVNSFYSLLINDAPLVTNKIKTLIKIQWRLSIIRSIHNSLEFYF